MTGLAPVAIGRKGANTYGLHPCVGYYDRPDSEPVYDPGWGVTPCLVCWKPLGDPTLGGDPIEMSGLLYDDESDLIMFYRVHETCAQDRPEEMAKLDPDVLRVHRDEWSAEVKPEDLASLPAVKV